MAEFSTPLLRRLMSVRRSGAAPVLAAASCRRSSPTRSLVRHLHLGRQESLRKAIPHSLHTSRASSTQSHPSTSAPTYFPPPPDSPPERKSLLSRILRFSLISSVFFVTGFIMAASPAAENLKAFRDPPTDEETLTLFHPAPDTQAAEVEAYIQRHPFVEHLRQNATLRESRPHLKIPEAVRSNTLTAGTLLGEDRIAVPPIQFADGEGTEMIALYYLGKSLCGHPGIVHGGLLATLMDEGLARCCFESLPNKVGMTASLKIDYRLPCKAEQWVVLRARTTKTEGRKAWVVGKLMALESPEEWMEGEKAKITNGVNGESNGEKNGETDAYDWGRGGVVVESEGLFVEPKQAATMKRLMGNKRT